MKTRSDALREIESHAFDVCVIGAGATGAGCALDAQLRGLRTVLLDAGDFASGSSSASTKLVHGGVRYLQQAVAEFDFGQLKVIRQALRERILMLEIAPHLAHPCEFVVPCFSRFETFYYGVGLKLYDWFAGKARLGREPAALATTGPAVAADPEERTPCRRRRLSRWTVRRCALRRDAGQDFCRLRRRSCQLPCGRRLRERRPRQALRCHRPRQPQWAIVQAARACVRQCYGPVLGSCQDAGDAGGARPSGSEQRRPHPSAAACECHRRAADSQDRGWESDIRDSLAWSLAGGDDG